MKACVTRQMVTQELDNATQCTDYSYDANGNTLSVTSQANATLYTYDGFNRQISVQTGESIAEYSYLANGMRHSKTVDGITTTHIWDGSNIIADVVDDTVTAKYLCGIGLIAADFGTARSYYLYNAHGDVTGLTDTSGAVTQRYDYDAFGNEQAVMGFFTQNDANPFRYCGEYLDAETGTYYLRARYYNSSTGRFTQEDPANAGLNWYTYCHNNPVAFSDPFGLMSEDEIKDVMKKYENNEMAPMSYSYSMELIYDWYLADGDTAKADIDKAFYSFRNTGYTTTNGSRRDVDEGIAFMATKPGWNMTAEEHYFRNKLNLEFSFVQMQTINSRVPDYLKFERELADAYHQNQKLGNDKNEKYVSSDGYFEMVFSGADSGRILWTAANNYYDMGTYNFYGPKQNAFLHFVYDVRPYGINSGGGGYGNTRAHYLEIYQQYKSAYGTYPDGTMQ